MAISQTGFAYLTDYTNTEDMNHAETLYKEAVVLARKLGNRQREAGSLGNLGFIETARFEQTKDKAASCRVPALKIQGWAFRTASSEWRPFVRQS